MTASTCSLLSQTHTPESSSTKMSMASVPQTSTTVYSLPSITTTDPIGSHPNEHIINVGNPDTVSVREFVQLCYGKAGKPVQLVEVHSNIPQRAYFCFHDYDYKLDVTLQHSLLDQTVPLEVGLAESYAWYTAHPQDVLRKDYISFIDEHLTKTDR